MNDDTAERLQGFKESVKLDVECATTISGSLETAAVEKFIDILENCSGRVLVSGIGRYQGL
jgi:D-arabinose 5-phosphate isomerase GutQ